MQHVTHQYHTPTKSLRRGKQRQSGGVQNTKGGGQMTQQYYKTRLCPFLVKGDCRKGKSCTYAHSEFEVKRRPDLARTKLCELWQKGQCSSTSCVFAHGREELRHTFSFYKTRLCHFWKTAGACNKGSLCRHAHGVEELRHFEDSGRIDDSSDGAATDDPHSSNEAMPAGIQNPTRYHPPSGYESPYPGSDGSSYSVTSPGGQDNYFASPLGLTPPDHCVSFDQRQAAPYIMPMRRTEYSMHECPSARPPVLASFDDRTAPQFPWFACRQMPQYGSAAQHQFDPISEFNDNVAHSGSTTWSPLQGINPQQNGCNLLPYGVVSSPTPARVKPSALQDQRGDVQFHAQTINANFESYPNMWHPSVPQFDNTLPPFRPSLHMVSPYPARNSLSSLPQLFGDQPDIRANCRFGDGSYVIDPSASALESHTLLSNSALQRSQKAAQLSKSGDAVVPCPLPSPGSLPESDVVATPAAETHLPAADVSAGGPAALAEQFSLADLPVTSPSATAERNLGLLTADVQVPASNFLKFGNMRAVRSVPNNLHKSITPRAPFSETNLDTGRYWSMWEDGAASELSSWIYNRVGNESTRLPQSKSTHVMSSLLEPYRLDAPTDDSWQSPFRVTTDVESKHSGSVGMLQRRTADAVQPAASVNPSDSVPAVWGLQDESDCESYPASPLVAERNADAAPSTEAAFSPRDAPNDIFVDTAVSGRGRSYTDIELESGSVFPLHDGKVLKFGAESDLYQLSERCILDILQSSAAPSFRCPLSTANAKKPAASRKHPSFLPPATNKSDSSGMMNSFRFGHVDNHPSTKVSTGLMHPSVSVPDFTCAPHWTGEHDALPTSPSWNFGNFDGSNSMAAPTQAPVNLLLELVERYQQQHTSNNPTSDATPRSMCSNFGGDDIFSQLAMSSSRQSEALRQSASLPNFSQSITFTGLASPHITSGLSTNESSVRGSKEKSERGV